MKVLIVDDSKAIHAFVKDIFDGTKVELAQAFNGQEAVDYLKTNGEVDLVFLDWEMPVMDGPTAFTEIRNIFPGQTIVMMTTKSSNDNIMQMLEAGVNEYMMKPFTDDIVFEKIQSVTGVDPR